MPLSHLLPPVQPTDPRGPRGKLATRRALLTVRDAMTAEARAAAALAIGDATNMLLARRLSPDAVVAIYAAKGSEVDTARIDAALRAAGMTVAYPRVVPHQRRLVFHAVPLDALATAQLGLREPSADAAAVELADIAAFIVPGLAFDRAGGRIGWGRGHYDATFAAASPDALRIGLAYDCQLVEHVAREPHDVALHIIITEVATHVVV
ncbi:MAG TPA: 5-formyltetrahydrofolate cyclo-ligase [Kofleriaceae bacterium]|nr:5-formyltetrahydrofolate cyclo-ligase [Kofleriaceae bacterium]